MSDQEINRAISMFCGDFEDLKTGPCFQHSWNYCTDFRGIRNALKFLSKEQKDVVLYRLLRNANGARWMSFEQMLYAMNLPTREWAKALFEAITEQKGHQ